MPSRKPRTRLQARDRTDDSLRTERKKIDDARKGDRASADRDADGVVDQARAVADAVLSAARVKADHKSLRARGRTAAGVVSGERERADTKVRGERASADDALRMDRQDRADALDALLVHERAVTDAYLLTERVRSDDAVAHRDDFLGMVAHDVRNLLNAVVLNLGLLDPAASGSERAAAAVGRIRRNVARMNRLIGDLVDVTSIDAGKLAMTPVEGNAATLVIETAETFQPAADEKGIRLSAHVPESPLHAVYDHDRLVQVLANLVSNAIKFTPQGGAVDVRIEKGRGSLRFSVTDTGMGIPATMLDAIFERFWQVGKNDRKGQGLGLYISKSIVEAHRGRIWAESEPGKGSRMLFTIPVPSGGRDRRRPRHTA
jgi:signal transduction histidine kinase